MLPHDALLMLVRPRSGGDAGIQLSPGGADVRTKVPATSNVFWGVIGLNVLSVSRSGWGSRGGPFPTSGVVWFSLDRISGPTPVKVGRPPRSNMGLPANPARERDEKIGCWQAPITSICSPLVHISACTILALWPGRSSLARPLHHTPGCMRYNIMMTNTIPNYVLA